MKPNQVPNQGQSLGPIVGRNMGLWLILEPKLGLNYQTNYKETKTEKHELKNKTNSGTKLGTKTKCGTKTKYGTKLEPKMGPYN